MFQHFLRSQRIFAMLLVAMLALVQIKVAFAGCMTADASISTSVLTMENCQECSTDATNREENSYDALSRICGNHCVPSFASLEQNPELPATAVTIVALVDTAAVLPLVSPQNQAPALGKVRLIYRLQRLLI